MTNQEHPAQIPSEEVLVVPIEETDPSRLERAVALSKDTIQFYKNLGKIIINGNVGEAVKESARHLS